MFESLKEKLGLEGEEKPLKSSMFIQSIFLSCPSNGKRFEPIQYLKCFSWQVVLGFPFYSGLLGHFLMTSSSIMLSERLVSLSLIIQITIQVYNLISCIHFGNKLLDLLDRIDSKKFGRPENLLREFRRQNTYTLFSYCVVCILVVVYSLHNYHFNMYCDGRRLLNDKRYVCGLLTPAWYPFETDSEEMRIFFALSYFVFILLVIPHGILAPVCAVGIMRFMKARVEDLKNQINNVENVRVGLFSRKFKFFMDYYGDVFGCINDMNNCMGYCMVPQYTLVTLMIALLVYNIVVAKNYMELGALSVWLSVEALFCFNAQALENEHESLLESINNLPWYEMTSKDKMNYRIFLGQVQIPIHVKALPVVNLNNKFLLSILHGTYSILMFFLRFDS